ncbi:hypothetical protein BDV93DRAFT_396797, partial [Ceratobasidium sp. AG-I]
IDEIGLEKVAAVVSDDTNVTKKARRDLTAVHPFVLNLADPLHKLNLCVQDICGDPMWLECLEVLWPLLTHFKHSTSSTNVLKEMQKELKEGKGLQSIGKTRFATLYYAAKSVYENLQGLYLAYKRNRLAHHLCTVFDKRSYPAMLFKMNLKQLISVLEPIARAIKCLESTQSTLVDIFVFWQAVLGRILELFLHSNSGFSNAEQTQIRRAIIHHYNETIHDAPTNAYLTAFFLDP